jgi:hypothetical protein
MISDEKVTSTKSEVQRLLDAGFIREVQYPSWIANVVMVKKKEWQMKNVHRFHRSQQVLSKG